MNKQDYQLQRAAEAGDVEAQYKLGMHYEEMSRTDFEKKKEYLYWLKKAAQTGHIKALKELAEWHLDEYFELEPPHDGYAYRSGIKYLKKAALLGSVEAQIEVGENYRYRCGKRNEKEALKWYLMAAESGDPECMYQLADYCWSLDEDYGEEGYARPYSVLS